MRHLLTTLTALLILAGCSAAPIQGGFQAVCDRLVDMSPAERATNMNANGPYYERSFGLHYDAVTDAIYTYKADGGRDYILKGDIIRATFLIDTRKKTKPHNNVTNPATEAR